MLIFQPFQEMIAVTTFQKKNCKREREKEAKEEVNINPPIDTMLGEMKPIGFNKDLKILMPKNSKRITLTTE